MQFIYLKKGVKIFPEYDFARILPLTSEFELPSKKNIDLLDMC